MSYQQEIVGELLYGAPCAMAAFLSTGKQQSDWPMDCSMQADSGHPDQSTAGDHQVNIITDAGQYRLH